MSPTIAPADNNAVSRRPIPPRSAIKLCKVPSCPHLTILSPDLYRNLVEGKGVGRPRVLSTSVKANKSANA